jgi:DNA topoisomerase-1
MAATKKSTKTARKPARKPAKKSAGKPAKKTARKSARASAAKRDGPSLVIVESPAKARTIGRFLGKEFEVRASMGHVRDLPKKSLGIKMDDEGFHPRYTVIEGKSKVVKELSTLARRAPAVYFATDLDREGEAIAWHLGELLEVPEDLRARVTFHEITRRAIEEAFAHPGKFDENRVNAWQARRVLDRIVGYPLSRLLSKSVSRGLSAGRVQSVALRLIVQREKRIRAFVPEDYWRVTAELRKRGADDASTFEARLVEVSGLDVHRHEDAQVAEGADDNGNGAPTPGTAPEDGEARTARSRADGLRLDSLEQAELVLAEARSADWAVEEVEAKRRAERPQAPFITSTLQQAASTRLRWAVKHTMRVAQQLYEGLPVGGRGPVGLITYMRTDSVSLAPEAVKACRDLVAERFGPQYVPAKPHSFRSRKGAQEAHEAIRPTDVARTPESLRTHLDDDHYQLYRLVWQRFVASQMASAQIDTTVVRMRAGRALFETRGSVVAFPGWQAVLPRRAAKDDDAEIPSVQQGEALALVDVRHEQSTTKPPARYTEASLVRRLEREGIGRPSTYADIITKIQARKYVEKQRGKFHATELGEVVTDRMVPYFPHLLDVEFTRNFEGELDAVESGKEGWQALMRRFNEQFERELAVAREEMPKEKFAPAEGVDPCDACGKPMVVRFSQGRKFYGCSGYPECKATRSGDNDSRPAPVPTDHVCEKCGKPMVIRQGRRGPFLACTGYPDCRNAKDVAEDGSILESEPTGETCEKCGKDMVVKRGRRGPFLACSGFPECRNARDIGSPPNGGESGENGAAAPAAELPPCPKCGGEMKLRRSRRGSFCGCVRYPECKGTAPAPAGAQAPRAAARPAGVDCKSCGKPMMIRRGKRGEFAGCSGFPGCRETVPLEQLPGR